MQCYMITKSLFTCEQALNTYYIYILLLLFYIQTSVGSQYKKFLPDYL